MSKDNITVYARWIRKEYRIFLHPDVPTTETTYKDNFEAAGLSASFRVNYGEKIEGIDKVIRDDKKLIGWYTKTVVDGKDVYKPFNIEAYALNDSTAPDTYDKSRSTELDAFGNSTESTNKDTNRRWILNRLDLYARWRDELIGADGINVYYYVENGTKQIYVDETEDVLYADQATATALDIPSEYAEITSEDKIFSHWVVQKYNNTTGKFEDTDTIAKEGHEFGVFKSDAKKTELEGSTQAVPKFSYEVHLKAVYKPKKDDNIKTTKIIYNGNGGTTSLASDESQNCTVNTDKTTVKYDKLQLNTELTITDAGFTRENYELLGWSKYEPNAENVYTVDFKVGDVVGVDELPNKNNTLFGVWKKKEATYIVKYYKDEIDPNDETKNCVGESSKFTAEVGAQIRLVSGDQDGKLNYKKNALDNPDYYLDGVQQNPVPYVMQESTYNQDGTPVPQVIKVLYTRKTATYIVKYYKDEIDSNDETKNYVGEGTPHTAEVGTTIRLVSGDQDSQLNYKKNALDNPDYYLDGVQQGDVPYTMKESTYKEDGTPIPQVIKVLYARKTATYIVKYYKDEIDPNDETKNYVGESDVYPAYVGAEIRLSEGDQDAQLNNKKTRDALNDDPANYLDGVQQNPVPYIMKESTYDEEERPVPQVIKVLYAHKTTSYRIEYYKGEVINDAEHHLTPDVTVTNVKVGTEVNLTTEQLNAKKPAEGYTDGEQLNELKVSENADENVVKVLYRPTEIIVTIQGKQVETFYTGQEQNTNMFPKEGFAENKGYRVVSIKDLAGVDITNLPESEIHLIVEGSDIARGTEANTPANVQYPENYPMGLKGGYNRTDDGCSFECFSELYERIKFVVEDGWLKINPAEDQIVVTITGNTDSVLYNGQDQSVTGYTVDSITLNGETFTGITAEDIALADGAEAKATGKDVKRNAVTRAIENYMMGLVGSEAAQCSFKCTNPNYSNVTFVVRDGYIKINPLQLTVEVIGNRGEEYYDGTEKRVTGYTLNPLSEEVSNGNAGGNQDVARFFDRNKVVFTGEDVAKGILPATYPMGLTTTQFSYEDANIEVTYIVTDGQLIIKDRPDGQKFHVVARTPDRTVQFSGKTWVGSEFDYTVEGTVSGVNTLTRVLNSIGDVIGRVLGIDAHAADAAKEVEINSLKFKVSGLKVDVNARNVGQYDLTIVNEAFKVIDENGNDVTRQFDDPELIFGKLTITPKPIEITSSSASKVYDATPLTSHSVTENTTWGEGDAVTYNYTGSQLNPGTSKNYFTVAPANRLTDFNNYEISLVYGDLTVTDQSNVNPPDNNDPENPNNNTPDEPEKEKEKKNKKKNKKTDTPPTQYDDSNNDNNDSAVNNTTPADQRQVLGAKREQGEQPGVLGARRGGTEDNTNTSRIFVLLIAAGAAATLLALGKKRKKNDEQ